VRGARGAPAGVSRWLCSDESACGRRAKGRRRIYRRAASPRSARGRGREQRGTYETISKITLGSVR
jgi:hypothetical protein